MERTCERLHDDRFFDRHVLRNLVHDRFFRVDHVFGHRAVYVILKAVEIVFLTHPIAAGIAETTVPARHDLFRDNAIADGDAEFFARAFTERYDTADELVAGRHRRLDVTRLILVAPERRSTVKRFDVARADAGRFDLREYLEWTRRRNRNRFQAVIARRVCDDRLHHLRIFGTVGGLLGRGHSHWQLFSQKPDDDS